jgi:hypothetical protein
MIKRGYCNGCGSDSRGPFGSPEHFLLADSERKVTFISLRHATHLPIICLLAVSIAMAGCGITGTKASGSLTPVISIAVSQAPPASLLVGNAVPVSATVTNDTANAGVDWVAVCDSAPRCGSFSPSHTASGGNTIFTAPLAVPAHSTIAVTALSATNHGTQSVASVIILSSVSSVTITQAPPASAPAGAIITLAATVIGDPANLGVDWKASCGTTGVQRQPVDCTPPGLHSDAGGSTLFTVPVPVQIPNIVGSTVTITAFAAADHNFNTPALFTVTIPITINLTQVPPSTMLTNAKATVAAVATNDTTNSGVDWSVSCSTFPCGSVFPAHTASGQAAIFTAPPTVPSPNGVVVVTATSTAGGLQVFATVGVTIVAPLSVRITTQVPINTIVKNSSAPLVATVSNDAANAGVDWTVSCGSLGACGTFSPAHTASGATTTFTAPNAVPAGNTVTITATSSADPSQTAVEIVTVTTVLPSNSLLLGQFVILLSAKNSINGPFALGGFISGDGNGNITKGSLDLADASGNASSSIGILSPSTYSIGSDGRGQIQLLIDTRSLNGSFGVNGSGAITLSVVFLSPQHALLSETDSFGSATGTLDLQNANDLVAAQNGTLLNGNYSLILSGAETAGLHPGYTVAAAATIHSSASSYGVSAYVADQSAGGAITSASLSNVSYFGQASLQSNGELTMNSVNLGLPTRFNLDVWLIDANHFAVTDWRDSFSGTPNIIAAGYLTAQPSSPAISGAYAFTEAGATSAALPQAAGGIFSCGSSGALDVTPLGGTVTMNQAIATACSAPASGRGLITISGAGFTGISQFAAYPTLDQGLYLVELDGGSTGTSGSSGAGLALQQTVTSPVPASDFSGKYASSFLASTPGGLENFAAQIISDGVSAISGAADVNSFNATAAPPVGTPSSNTALTGSFTAGADGRSALTLTITPAAGQPVPSNTTLHIACYVVDANTCLLLGLDATAPGTGILQLQQPGL